MNVNQALRCQDTTGAQRCSGATTYPIQLALMDCLRFALLLFDVFHQLRLDRVANLLRLAKLPILHQVILVCLPRLQRRSSSFSRLDHCSG